MGSKRDNLEVLVDGATQKEFRMSDPGEKLYFAAANGKTEEVRRLLAEKAPLEYNKDPREHIVTRAQHTRSLSVAKGGAERA